jgi:uncharacterized protein YbjQ (UPF0145 family)
MAVLTGLSGNEIYCLSLKGLRPGDLVIGNSVFSLGFLGSLGAGWKGMVGGEIEQLTSIIHEGRTESYRRMVHEATQRGGVGIAGVTSELRHFHGNTEFISVASTLHGTEPAAEKLAFTTSADGQELYCQIDAGFTPKKSVFGNVAYSVGAPGGIVGAVKSLGRGEIKEFSDAFNLTRHLALRRISKEAAAAGANAVVGIETNIMCFEGAHEMMMIGTASHHPALPPECQEHPVTSDLTCEEMWNLVHLGYLPLKLLLATAVYSLGVVGGIKAMFSSFTRGENKELTSLVYDAREHAIGMLKKEAESIGADDVVGIKTHISEQGNLLEFMAIGTAVKRFPGVRTETPSLPAQAIMKDKETWIS